jgi:hypothetical protein
MDANLPNKVLDELYEVRTKLQNTLHLCQEGEGSLVIADLQSVYSNILATLANLEKTIKEVNLIS